MDITVFWSNPSAWGIGLAVIFGAVWLASLAPLGWRGPWSWLILVVGALLFSPLLAWVQIPFQNLIGDWLVSFFGVETFETWLFLMAVPLILLSGLIQEGAKLVPVVVYWWRKGRNIDPKLGLSIGAMVGVGFGIFEAQFFHNGIFASGWSWGLVELYGVMALAGFWERFFTIAFHTAASALAGWGLAKGWGWQFYLLVSFFHFLLNYLIVFVQKGMLTSFQAEILIAIGAVAVFGVVLWLRWWRTVVLAEGEVAPPEAGLSPPEA